MTRIEEIGKEIQKIYEELRKLDETELEPTYEQYEKNREPFHKKLGALSREKRLLLIPEYDELPKYGNVMSLKNFIASVKSGAFIDYDGSGKYVKDGKCSNISIYPSDVEYKAIRKDFDTIIWFNR